MFAARLCSFVIIPLLFVGCQSQITSENNDKLRNLLLQRPMADLDGDGVLTAEEAKQFEAKRRAGREARDRKIAATPKPEHMDVSYGPHERNVLDLYESKRPGPAPLIVYFHGGGFVSGHKGGMRLEPNRDRYLEAGFALAGVSYRYRTMAPIQEVLRDGARAIQFMRANAERFRIDPTRIAAYGGSAGAGMSLWLAFHDDLADPNSEDPVLRESSRLTAAAGFGPQFTYDMPQWNTVLGVNYLDFYNPDASFFGLESIDQLDTDQGWRVRADIDMRGLITPDDPPVWLLARQEDVVPHDLDSLNHHPRHVVALKEKLDAVGVPAEVYLSKMGSPPPNGEDDSLFNFLAKHLMPGSPPS